MRHVTTKTSNDKENGYINIFIQMQSAQLAQISSLLGSEMVKQRQQNHKTKTGVLPVAGRIKRSSFLGRGDRGKQRYPYDKTN